MKKLFTLWHKVFKKKRTGTRDKSIAVIARAFPGLFHYEDLLNLDAGNFALWLDQASSEVLNSYSRNLKLMRIAIHANTNDYQGIITKINDGKKRMNHP